MDQFWLTMLATMVGAAVALLGSWLIYRLQRESARRERVNAALSLLLQRLPADMTVVGRAVHEYDRQAQEIIAAAAEDGTQVDERRLDEIFDSINWAFRSDLHLHVTQAIASAAALEANHHEFAVIQEIEATLIEMNAMGLHGIAHALSNLSTIIVNWRHGILTDAKALDAIRLAREDGMLRPKRDPSRIDRSEEPWDTEGAD
jgi:hypothetical protein